MSAPVSLRPMRWWDVEAAYTLEVQLFSPDTWSVETFWSELAADGRCYLVAEADRVAADRVAADRVAADCAAMVRAGNDGAGNDGAGDDGAGNDGAGKDCAGKGCAAENVGTVALLGYAGLAVNGSQADVQTVAVSPHAQGRGVGRLLLGALVAEAAARGATSLLLEVRADNEAARALYTRTGFEQIAVRRKYYQPGDIDAHVMRLRPLTAFGGTR